jgi:hypothetical protein
MGKAGDVGPEWQRPGGEREREREMICNAARQKREGGSDVGGSPSSALHNGTLGRWQAGESVEKGW